MRCEGVVVWQGLGMSRGVVLNGEEREEISRGIAAELSGRMIAKELGRDPPMMNHRFRDLAGAVLAVLSLTKAHHTSHSLRRHGRASSAQLSRTCTRANGMV